MVFQQGVPKHLQNPIDIGGSLLSYWGEEESGKGQEIFLPPETF